MNKKHIIFSTSIFILLLLLFTSTALAQSELAVYVDGTEVDFPDQMPFINQDNRTLVPIRFIAEEMGAEVNWKDAKELVKIERDATLITLFIGESRARVNNQWRYFDTKAEIHNGRTMVPLRFISETLDVKVKWDGASYAAHSFTSGQCEDEINMIMGIVSDEIYAQTNSNPFMFEYSVSDNRPYLLSAEEKKMFDLVNEERSKAGVAALELHTGARDVARIKSKEMIDLDYFSHISPVYGPPYDMLAHFGQSFYAAGENLALHRSVESAHEGLMNSPGHRDNILSGKFTHIGIGAYQGPRGQYFTQMFITPR